MISRRFITRAKGERRIFQGRVHKSHNAATKTQLQHLQSNLTVKLEHLVMSKLSFFVFELVLGLFLSFPFSSRRLHWYFALLTSLSLALNVSTGVLKAEKSLSFPFPSLSDLCSSPPLLLINFSDGAMAWAWFPQVRETLLKILQNPGHVPTSVLCFVVFFRSTLSREQEHARRHFRLCFPL